MTNRYDNIDLHLSAPNDTSANRQRRSHDLDRIVAEARALGEARAREEKESSKQEKKRGSHLSPGQPSSARTSMSNDASAQNRDEYNPIRIEDDERRGFKDWWRRHRMHHPHGAVAAMDVIGQGALYVVLVIFN